jgi:glycosyltransferase involved in cell wall biosynthesis
VSPDDQPYSVLLPVYRKDDPAWLGKAIDSMLAQTAPPAEFLVVADGPITPELQGVLDGYSNVDGFRVHQLPENVGLGLALAAGVTECRNELIARMDADDYSLPHRCATQLEHLAAHPQIDVLGSSVAEFTGSIDNIVSHVSFPTDHDGIVRHAKRRSPVRHPALMYRRTAVLKAGNYNDLRRGQDYDLIVRMILSGARFANLEDELTYMQVTPDFYSRRGGLGYLPKIIKMRWGFVRYGFFNLWDFIASVVPQAGVALLPTRVRKAIFLRLQKR